MKIKRTAFRLSASILFMFTLVGVAQPPQSASAAVRQQQGGEGWGHATSPAPQHVQVVMSAEPPPAPRAQSAEDDQPGPQGRLPGPVTPQGADAGTPNAPWIPPTSAGGSGPRAAGDFVVFYNSSLSDGPERSQISEPSAANNGQDIFATYNFYAGLSTDYGVSWDYIDPVASFPTNPHNGFCCDQDAFYDPSRDLMLWLLMYSPDEFGNVLRLAVAQGQTDLELGSWYFYDLPPESYCATANSDWFDFPHLTQTDDYLYLASNVFTAGSVFECTTMIRISLDDVAEGEALENPYYWSAGFNFTAAHGGTDTLYFARHEDTTHLRVYTWPESAGVGSVTSALVPHAPFETGSYECAITGLTGPGSNPCGYDDDRVIAGWFRPGDNELGFMWDARQDSPTYPYPYTHVLTMDATTKVVVTDTKLWNSDYAIFLPSSGVNARGDVGGTIAWAGGSIFPNCDAWIYDDFTPAPGFVPDMVGVTPGTGAPTIDRWGDFLRTRMSSEDSYQWIGTCYSIEGGEPVPRVVRFGRERDGDTQVYIGGILQGAYDIHSGEAILVGYPSINNGPVRVIRRSADSIFASERVAYSPDGGATWTTYSEMMGLPEDELTTAYWFPWYNSVHISSQVSVGNLGSTSTTVTVRIGGVVRDTYVLAPNQSKRIKYPGLNTGPVLVTSSGGVPIIASERVAYSPDGGTTWTSMVELLGTPASQLTDTYSFPWYNAVDHSMQVSVANVGSSSTTITVEIAGSVVDTYTLGVNKAKRIKYFGTNTGPVVVTSSGGVPIIASERTAYSPDGGVTWARFAEMIGMPGELLEGTYVLPWYNHPDHDMDLAVGNVGLSSTTVTVTIGGNVVDSYSLDPNEATRVEYLMINSGPVEVTSSGSVSIVASEGAKYSPDGGVTYTSYSELMGLPASLMYPIFAFPWYNSYHINTLVQVAAP